MLDLGDWNPERLTLTGAAMAVLVVVVRAALTRKWVPGIYFQEARAERDAAREEAKRNLELASSLTASVARLTDENHRLVRALTDRGTLPPSAPSVGVPA